MDFIDVRRAYFHAPAMRDVYVELPDEDKTPGMCGKLLKSMYGTRDAGLNWEATVAKVMISIGFERGVSNPCVYYHPQKNIRTEVHGDDFVIIGRREGREHAV